MCIRDRQKQGQNSKAVVVAQKDGESESCSSECKSTFARYSVHLHLNKDARGRGQLRNDLCIIAANVSRKINSLEALISFVESLRDVSWDLLYLAEMDQFLYEIDVSSWGEALGGCIVSRHYGGEGNIAYGIVVRSHLSHLITKSYFGSRCGGFAFSRHGRGDLIFVGVHGDAHGDSEATIESFLML